jgi:ribose 5-phosphate isomerase B
MSYFCGDPNSVAQIDDALIHQIVQRVLSQAAGLSQIPSAPSAAPVAVPQPAPSIIPKADAGRNLVAIGADHGGFDLKELLKPEITALGFEVTDCGTHGKDAVDYPDFAHAVAQLVGSGAAARGIVIDGAGIGSCIAANKVPGVRAGLAYDLSSANNGREHNDTNVLTLGAGLIGAALAKQIVKTWLTTPFAGGRHAARVAKITAIEKQYLK